MTEEEETIALLNVTVEELEGEVESLQETINDLEAQSEPMLDAIKRSNSTIEKLESVVLHLLAENQKIKEIMEAASRAGS